MLDDKSLTEEERSNKASAIAANVYNYGSNVVGGLTSLQTILSAVASGTQASAAFAVADAAGPLGWIVAGVVVVAKTGIDYKKMKDGKLTEEQFKKN